jgi:hypothetical protein
MRRTNRRNWSTRASGSADVSAGEAGWFGAAGFSGETEFSGEAGVFGEAGSAAAPRVSGGFAIACLAATPLPVLRERFVGGTSVATAAHGSDANKKVCCQVIPIPFAHILFARIWTDPPPHFDQQVA